MFTCMDDKEVNNLIDFTQVQTLQAGEEVNVSDCLCIVLEGEIEVDGSGVVGPGKALGEMGMIQKTGSTITGVANRRTRICKLSRTVYEEAGKLKWVIRGGPVVVAAVAARE